MSALKESHPYQEVAYECHAIENESQVGSGVIGELKKAMPVKEFLSYIKKNMKCDVIKYSLANKRDNIKKVAVCGGSGSFLLQDAVIHEADAYVSSDFKYHDFFNSNNQVLICDIGHYESEFFTQHLISDILKENFSKLAVRLTSVCTNPVLYY